MASTTILPILGFQRVEVLLYFIPDTWLQKSNTMEKKENEKECFQLSGQQRWVYLCAKKRDGYK
jgi:hypothetical protein